MLYLYNHCDQQSSIAIINKIIVIPNSFLLQHTQLEQEVESLNRKLKLLEADLDMAEDKAADQGEKVKHLEDENEGLTRENKQLQHKVQTLEGMV